MPDAEASSGALSIDQAIDALVSAPIEPEQEPEAPISEAPEPEQAAETSDAADDSEAVEPEDAGVETEDAEAEAVAPLEAPAYWSHDAKAKFSELPPELQAVVLSQEGPREEAAAKAKQEAAAEVAAAKKQLEGVQTLAEQLNAFLPEAVATFRNRWGDPDWAKVAEEQGADQAFILKAQYDREQQQLVQLQQTQAQAQAEAQRAFVQTEFEVLAEIAPDLAPDRKDPSKGSEARQRVSQYLVNSGIPVEALNTISAREMVIADKARRWDEAQAALKAKPKPAPTVPQRATVRPAAAPVASPQRAAEVAKNRFAQTRSIDDAVALLVSKGQQ